MELNIRKMTRSDIPFFNRVRNASREFLHDTTKYSVEESYTWWDTTNPEYYILQLGDSEIGYFRTSNRTVDSIWIGLDIDPAHRGKHYAKPAYEIFMRFIRTVYKIEIFYLKVKRTNTIAASLYFGLGFIVYDHTDDDYFMIYGIAENDYASIKDVVGYDDIRKLKNKTIYIFGANGFIGRWFGNFFDWLNQHHGMNINIVLSDIKYNGLYYRQSNRVSFKELDICYQHAFQGSHIGGEQHPDYIINCAGIANPSQYMKTPIQCLDVSYIGTKNILESCIYNSALKSVVMFSSSEVYGTPEPEHIPTPETHVGKINTMSNRSCYDVGKLVLETLCYEYRDKVPVNIIRPFNLYGPFMEDSRIIPNYFNSLFKGEPLVVYGDGKQTRTYCYIADAIAAILKIMVSDSKNEIYNVGNPEPEITPTQLAEKILSGSSKQVPIEVKQYPDTYPSNEPTRRCPDISKIKSKFNISPSVSLTRGLIKTYNYFKFVHYEGK